MATKTKSSQPEEAAPSASKTPPTIDFLQDPPEEQTYSRQLATWLCQNYPAVYGLPSTNYSSNNSTASTQSPSFAKAWAFFEHVTLERYMLLDNTDDNDEPQQQQHSKSKRQQLQHTFHQGDRKLSIAEPGENQCPTRLYSPLTTPLSQLGDFGLGFGLYFATVRDFALLLLVGGLLSLPNILFFASEDYDANANKNLPNLLKGSAICTDRSYVPCPTCTVQEFDGATGSAYQITRLIVGPWTTISSSSQGLYWNITDYLEWSTIPPLKNNQNAIRLDQLINVSLPDVDGTSIQLSAEGYILDGVNITERLDYTPLWCSYQGVADCYLDLYPLLVDKHLRRDVDPTVLINSEAKQHSVGDSDFVQAGFAWKNHCNGATYETGFVNYAVLWLIALGTVLVWVRVTKMEAEFDEDEQTAQDYSIVVKNPPDDAYDPTEWKEFFEAALEQDNINMHNSSGEGTVIQNTSVTVCTVDVDNELMIAYLTKRREILRAIELALPPSKFWQAGGSNHHNDNSIKNRAFLEAEKAVAMDKRCFGMLSASKLPALYQSLLDIEAQIKTFFEETQERPRTTHVYLTFETEAAQRQVLSQSSVGSLEARSNTISSVPKHYLFRGKHVLKVREPEEPTAIRWQELNATRVQIAVRKAITTLITFGFIAAAYYVITTLYRRQQPFFAALLTTIFTSAFPVVATLLMNFEKHQSETSRQKWLFLKVGVFNILVTTILLAVITPFQATLDEERESVPGLLPAVNKLFWSQITVAPVLQVLDIGGNVHRHILAPREKTQGEMNMHMRGTPVNLAERYAHLMKFLFMTLWYCSIYPGALFLGFFALLVTYFVDRFSLMRSWARSAQVGSQMADFAKQLFIPAAICLMSVVSAYFWSGFPYDNLCLVENEKVPDYYPGSYDISLESKTKVLFGFSVFNEAGFRTQFNISSDTPVYEFCNQDLRTSNEQPFPALSSGQPDGGEWMTSEQELVVDVHGGTSLWFVLLAFSLLLIAIAAHMRHFFFSGAHVTRGEDQDIAFSNVPAIDSYIPQVSSPMMAFPLILCDIKDIDKRLFNWEDDEHPHSEYDVTGDIAEILGTTSFTEVFAQVKYWPQKTSTVEAQD